MDLRSTQIPVNFESDFDDRLDTKKNNLEFPIYLSLHVLAEVCTLRVLLLFLKLCMPQAAVQNQEVLRCVICRF